MKMKISIFGLGYVGAVSAACLAKEGHSVIGVDPNTTKIALINEGKTPIIEKELEDMISIAVSNNLLRATSDVADAIASSSVSLICVGTPSQLNGSLDLKYVRNVCEEIGRALKEKESYHVIVIRSTMLPGTMENVVMPTLVASSGKKIGLEFGVCINPEFLRESTAVYDYFNPPKTVIGEADTKSGDILVQLFGHFEAPLIRVDVSTAEMVKYTDNVWHAVKVSFANEIGNICKEINIDSHKVMDIFCQDKKLNISSYYMKPGFAFGGSCLPKDVRALQYKAKSLDLELPLIGSLLNTNNRQIQRGYDLVARQANRKVAILGFSFKAGTDDLRESPIVELIEILLGKGYELKLYDNSVNIAKLTGANKDYILNAIPHISNLMVDTIDEAIAHGQTIVIGNNSSEFKNVLDIISEGQTVVDLVRVTDSTSIKGKYDGICW
jgi:GDP-mannose 6-dehydrogenase